MDYAAAKQLEAPLLLKGPVVKGFGRGSKELGIPTANLDAELLGAAVATCDAGVYYGWATVGASSEAHKMVMSIGWCVFAHTSASGLACLLAGCTRHYSHHWELCIPYLAASCALAHAHQHAPPTPP